METWQGWARSSTGAPSPLPPGRRIVLIMIMMTMMMMIYDGDGVKMMIVVVVVGQFFGVPRIGKWSQRVLKSCPFWRKERQIGPSASFSFVEEDEYNHQESSGGCPHKSYGSAAPVPWYSLGSASPISWRSTHPCSWSSEESPEKTSHVFSSNFCDQWSVNKGVCTDIFNKQSCV